MKKMELQKRNEILDYVYGDLDAINITANEHAFLLKHFFIKIKKSSCLEKDLDKLLKIINIKKVKEFLLKKVSKLDLAFNLFNYFYNKTNKIIFFYNINEADLCIYVDKLIKKFYKDYKIVFLILKRYSFTFLYEKTIHFILNNCEINQKLFNLILTSCDYYNKNIINNLLEYKDFFKEKIEASIKFSRFGRFNTQNIKFKFLLRNNYKGLRLVYEVYLELDKEVEFISSIYAYANNANIIRNIFDALKISRKKILLANLGMNQKWYKAFFGKQKNIDLAIFC